MNPLNVLRHHVTGAIERGETTAIAGMPGRYTASPALEAFIMRRAPAHYATDKDPFSGNSGSPNLGRMIDRYEVCKRTNAPFPVWSGGCERTIYSAPEVNHAFRAWHDSVHAELGAGFDREGEFAVAIEQYRELGRAIVGQTAPGLVEDDQRALWADVWGQFLYSEKHGGQFPDDQAAFVQAALDHGLAVASAATMEF